MAGKTNRIKLATGAFILPWNHPLRVVEKIVLLDHQSKGRAVLGLGRGLARREFRAFGIDMEETRARFDEAARMIIEATEKGFIEGDGPYYPQARTEIRPRPRGSFRDRLYMIGNSLPSVEQAAILGARVAVFSQGTAWQQWADTRLARYHELFNQHHGKDGPPPLIVDALFCDPSPKRAQEKANEFLTEYMGQLRWHYELDEGHLAKTRGYEAYAERAPANQAERDVQLTNYIKSQCVGTPEQIVKILDDRRKILGDYELSLLARFGSMDIDEACRSLTLFAEEAMPEAQSWS
jgi:alkanesulfonate monooxygenase SsuD/methylene tetrahydromethanopterin reductase-like flavin-dependent oxidoreductase (luciferase family)